MAVEVPLDSDVVVGSTFAGRGGGRVEKDTCSISAESIWNDALSASKLDDTTTNSMGCTSTTTTKLCGSSSSRFACSCSGSSSNGNFGNYQKTTICRFRISAPIISIYKFMVNNNFI